jgi:PhzF family phenazine biosynthesis protein
MAHGASFCDIGGHFGDTTITMALHAKNNNRSDLRFFTFEPSKAKCRFISEVIRLNELTDLCTVIQAAVGDEPGSVRGVPMKNKGAQYDGSRMYTRSEPSQEAALSASASASDDDDDSDDSDVSDDDETSYDMITLDSVEAQISPVGFLHVDVEGWEARVLEGSRSVLSNTKTDCSLIVECWTARECKRRGVSTEPDRDIENVMAQFPHFLRGDDLVDQERNLVYSARSSFAYARSDGFCHGGLGGNPAAVVLLEEAARARGEGKRTAIAAAINFSETVFVDSICENEVTLRYFTPEGQVDVCGHATVACLGFLKERGLLNGSLEGTLHLICGDMKFQIIGDLVFMQQLPVKEDEPLLPEDLQELLVALNISVADLDPSFPPLVASTGLRDIFVALQSEESLYQMTPNMAAVAALSEKLDTVGVHAAFLRGDDGGEIPVRNFAPRFMIDEEAATGTSNCALAGMLFSRRVGGDDAATSSADEITFKQGERMGAPSRIHVRRSGFVGGRYRIVEEGKQVIVSS